MTDAIAYTVFMFEMKGYSESYSTGEVLEPLTERYNETKHSRIYNLLSTVLCDALKSDNNHTNSSVFSKVRNIALSGGYGTGKSSVLCELKNDPKFQDSNGVSSCLFISLSSLNGQGGESADERRNKSDQTDLIEKEIVKQLLYQESSAISHFRRLRDIKPKRRYIYITILGILSLLLCIGLGWVEKIRSFFFPNSQIWASAVIVVALLVFFIFVWATFIPTTVQDHMRLKSMNAGSASLSLDSEDDETYFDKYLDEIAYFFSSSKKQVVIFEDLDRFNNTRIFEELKELNTILNQDPRDDGKAICFVYAVRDSIFDSSGNFDVSDLSNSKSRFYVVSDNLERANRTKFFDLIIPMVPFVSPTAAKGLISREFQDNGIDRQLISLLSKYITDMRLIKNIHNEFLVFRSELLSCGQGPDGQAVLDVNRVLAMVAYKNMYPRDFEKIRLGTSSLDDIYRFKLQILENTRNDVLGKIEERQNKIPDANRNTATSKKLGNCFKQSLKLVASGSQYSNYRMPLTIEGTEFSYNDEEQFNTIDFWITIASCYKKDNNLKIRFGNTISFDFRVFYDAVSAMLGNQQWMDDLCVAIPKKEIEHLRHSLSGIAHADIQTVMKEKEWVAPRYSEASKTICNLDELVRERYGHAIGSDLLASGYISDDYQLYAASRNGKWLSNDGVNFEIHNLGQGEHSLAWKLTNDDCEAIYTDFGPEVTKSQDAYNVQFLDWLLNQHPDQAVNMLKSPSDYDDWDREFYAAYLTDKDVSAENCKQIIILMTEKSDEIFNFLVDSQELGDDKREQYISIAVSNLRKETANRENVNASVSGYLRKCDSNLECMRDPKLSKEQAGLIANYYMSTGICLKDLSPLCPNMLDAIKKQRNYIVNKTNLKIIFGVSCDFSLNAIRKQDRAEFEKICDTCLSQYLETVDPKVTIYGDKSEYGKVVHDVIEICGKKKPDKVACNNIASLIKKSKPNQPITDLADIFPSKEDDNTRKIAETVVWNMAQYKLFVPTPRNIFVYLNTLNKDSQDSEKVNKSFDDLMEKMPLTVGYLKSNDLDDTQLLQLATLILNSNPRRFYLPGKLKLVESLNLSSKLDAEKLTDRVTPLFAELIKRGLLPSEASIFNLLKSETARIACIREWKTLMEGAKIPATELHYVLSDDRISENVKSAIYSKLPDYLNGAENNVIESVVRDAIEADKKISFKNLNWIANQLFSKRSKDESSSEENTNEYLKSFNSLLAIALSSKDHANGSGQSSAENNELKLILKVLPGEYSRLTEKTDRTESISLPFSKDNYTIATAVKVRLKTISQIRKLKGKAELQCNMRHNQ